MQWIHPHKTLEDALKGADIAFGFQLKEHLLMI